MKRENGNSNVRPYYVGLDIGTDSVGYAVTDEQYKPLKFSGEPMLGTHLIDAVEENVTRRTFRTARRRLDRKQQRVNFIREIFAEEIEKVDPDFYKRLDCSALFCEDKSIPSANSFFNDAAYRDRDYHKEYPTIHHLICALMNGNARKDARLLYLAVAYLVAHRGHFLNEVEKEDIEGVLDFKTIYDNFMSFFENPIWNCDAMQLAVILKRKVGVTAKEKALLQLLFDGKKPKITDDSLYAIAAIIKLLSGGTVKPEKLYLNSAYTELQSVSLSMKEEDFNAILASLEDDSELLVRLKKLYDWSILSELVPNGMMISESKVKVYEQHKRDLAYLKYFARKYLSKDKYNEIFRKAAEGLNNYVAYSYNLKNVEDHSLVKDKANKYEFCEYILKQVKDIAVEDNDKPAYEDMLSRLNKDVATFMPKQVDGDNRLIPYQLYYVELTKILDMAKQKYPFLTEADQDGFTPYQKILSVFLHRVPYYVGPLNRHSKHAWVVRSEERILPWKFEQIVDLDASEQAFIRKMTNKCTYLPDKDVLPKNSLLYTKFEVLNEINNLRINGEKIDVETKQQIFNDCFMRRARVTVKTIRDYLLSRGKMRTGDSLTGVDITVKSSLKAYLFFAPYLQNGMLQEQDVEEILASKAYSEDNFRFKKWLERKYPALSEMDLRKISNQKFKEFGRLSKEFLCETEGVCKETGEVMTIMQALWETNYNLMQLLSDAFTFREQIEAYVRDYYDANPKSISDRLSEMYISNAVKRPVIRTLDIIKDIVKVRKYPPAKIFVEMARGEEEKKRKASRREKILAFYKTLEDSDELNFLKEQLSAKEDRELQGEALYLYFMQRGRCMYSNQPIALSELSSGKYNVDHIYPRSFVKDDSLDNKVLVLSTINDEKDDVYPIEAEIRTKMYGFWNMLKEKDAISAEKFRRLTRSTPFTEEERWNFINRQLVETRQSTKAIATLLQELYPDTQIVYVKAGLVSEFRQAFGLLKARSVNDLHHAKDAYLNIVVGNVYNSVFTKRWFDPTKDKYTLKAKPFFGRTHKPGGVTVWEGGRSIAFVKEIMQKDHIHLTKYALCKHGKLFNVTLQKASEKTVLIPQKKGLNPIKYGGYNATAASFFMLVKCTFKQQELMFVPIEVMYADRFMADQAFAANYVKQVITDIVRKEPRDITFPLGMRKIKVNTVLELDGFRLFISSKSNRGRELKLSSMTSLKLSIEKEVYIKHLERFADKKKTAPNLRVDTQYDKITAEENLALYDIYLQKSRLPFFEKTLCAAVCDVLEKGREKFCKLSLEEQVQALLSIGSVFKTGKKGGCDLSLIGGKSNAGALTISTKVSNWKKKYTTAYIVDTGAAGFFEQKSPNLLELL